MNVQIFGSSKCFDTKKAERCFKVLISSVIVDSSISNDKS